MVAESLDPVIADITTILSLGEGYMDKGVNRWGLENRVIPLGYDFLEVVAPFREGTSAGRYLQRRHGPGGYMVILQTDDGLKHRKRITDMGVRTVFTADREDIQITQYHPGDCGGVLLEIDSVSPDCDFEEDLCPWPPGGPDWEKHINRNVVEGFSAIELQSANPLEMAQLWSDLLDMPVFNLGGIPQVKLLNSSIKFVESVDKRGNGLSLLELRVTDVDKILQAAETSGLSDGGDDIEICGTRIRLTQ